jgi:hypothetical protein
MSLIVPNTIEVEVITTQLTPALTLRLYSNNAIPDQSSSAASFTEVAGGGYGALPLTFANWTIASGDPSTGTYNTNQIFTFTGPTNAPGTIYGYYVTRNSDGKLMWAERFPAANVPFIPIAGSQILILPKFSAQSQF